MCGQTVAGLRQARFQMVPCPSCRGELFVLPASPLPKVAGAPEKAVAPGVSALSHRVSMRRLYVLAALGVLVLAGAVVLFTLWTGSLKPTSAEHALPDRPQDVVSPRWEKAQQLLGRGEFHQALAEAGAALRLHKDRPEGLAAAEERTWTQLHREAALLADLAGEALEEILRHAASLPQAEWEATFRRRFLGHAVIFDTEVVRTAQGAYRHGWRVFLPGQEARLDLAGLKLLDTLPLEAPQRLVFGARLAAARREPPGQWVITLEPDSGVLLTNAEAAALCCPALGLPEARVILRRQRTWVMQNAPPQHKE
jgi:hypothetical protein